jgi:hypothetical protein
MILLVASNLIWNMVVSIITFSVILSTGLLAVPMVITQQDFEDTFVPNAPQQAA